MMKIFKHLSAFAVALLLIPAALAAPLLPAEEQTTRDASLVHPLIMSLFSDTNTPIAPSERVSIAQAAVALQQDYEATETLKNIDVNPEEDQLKTYASWTDSDASDRCVEAKVFRKKLNNLFDQVTDKLGFRPREARALLRELYHMPTDQVIEKKNAKCLTDANSDEIVDLLVTISKVGKGQKFLVAPKNFDSDSGVAAAAAARQMATAALDVYVRSSQASMPPSVVDTYRRARSAQSTSLQLFADVERASAKDNKKDKCPYHYARCCLVYNVPGVTQPQQSYIDCCFQALYPNINSDWEDYYADLYPSLSPAEYTLLYCLLPSV